MDDSIASNMNLPFTTLIIGILMIAALWKIYTKAGKPGWASIIPIYNLWVWLKIINKPWWWLILFIVPGVNVIFTIWATNLLSLHFGKTAAFTIGLLFLPFIFFPILAWGDTSYRENIR